MTVQDIKNVFEEAKIEEPVSLVTVELRHFLTMELPPRELILTPWLPKSGLCMVHAFRGVGKTHVSLGIAFAVATGREFLGWQAPQPRNVLFIDGEMAASVLQERLASIVVLNQANDVPGKLRIITPDLQKNAMPDLSTIEGQALINQYITDEIDLIIVDNLSCLAPSIKENDASDWAPIQTWALQQRARGKSILLIHHSGKGGGQRGTSKKEDVLDTVIALERPKDYESSQGARFIIKYEKSRGFFGDEARSFEAQLSDTGWSTQTVEESTFQKVMAMTNDGLTQKDISTELGINKSNVSRYLSKARQQGLINYKRGGSNE